MQHRGGPNDDPSKYLGLINVRSETVTEKSSFRTAAAKRRCLLLPASGHYEWQQMNGGKQRTTYTAAATSCSHSPGPARRGLHHQTHAEPLCTATLITKAAPDVLCVNHDRTPGPTPPACSPQCPSRA
jgi:putative SOS response-associated peptidase YedK